jgi:hypothetical protein
LLLAIGDATIKTNMQELTTNQIGRQDFVDNAIYELIVSLNPSRKEISWDIEMISNVREQIAEWLVKRRKVCGESEFYPYSENGNS